MQVAANCLIIHQFYHDHYPFGCPARVFIDKGIVTVTINSC